MSNVILPTSKAQVSGHKFLMRRAQHGVVLGDIRMISDPLGRRRRALYSGAATTAIVGLGAGAMAVFSPAIDPGEAEIVRTESGALYVRIDAALHPVVNLASARLIVGEALTPARATDRVIAELPKGPPVGIVDAPGLITDLPDQTAVWSACHDEAGLDGAQPHVTVRLGSAPPELGDNQAVLAEVAGHSYVITRQGRAHLPAPDTPEGRIIRRRLGLGPQVLPWQPPAEVLNTIAELPPIHLPDDAQEILVTDSGAWLRTNAGLQPLTPLQHGILLDAGIKETRVSAGVLAEQPDATTLPANLPQYTLEFVSITATSRVCATGAAGTLSVVEVPDAEPKPSGVELSGNSIARSYEGPGVGVGVDTGHGYFIVSDVGQTHSVGSREELSALGVQEPTPAPWPVVRLLPAGSALVKDQALLPRY